MRRLIVGNSCESGLVEDVDAMRVIKKGMDSNKEAYPNFLQIAAEAVWRSMSPPNVADPPAKRAITKAQKARNEALKRREELRIGMPRVLNMYSSTRSSRATSRASGIQPQNLVYSDFTSEELYKEGAKRGAIDPCFPSKIGIPHVHDLLHKAHAKKPLDVIFFPMIDALPSPLKNTQGCRACPTVTATPEAVKAAFTKEGDLFAEMGIRYIDRGGSSTAPAKASRGADSAAARRIGSMTATSVPGRRPRKASVRWSASAATGRQTEGSAAASRKATSAARAAGGSSSATKSRRWSGPLDDAEARDAAADGEARGEDAGRYGEWQTVAGLLRTDKLSQLLSIQGFYSSASLVRNVGSASALRIGIDDGWPSDLGLRSSDFFRNSDFGIRISCWQLQCGFGAGKLRRWLAHGTVTSTSSVPDRPRRTRYAVVGLVLVLTGSAWLYLALRSRTAPPAPPPAAQRSSSPPPTPLTMN